MRSTKRILAGALGWLIRDSVVENDQREMAHCWYGYGRWDAPYWFIGPEPGQARNEHNDLRQRIEAWRDMGGGELIDCRAFHDRIRETRWHREKPRLQPTWRRLLLLLMEYLGRPWDKDSLRSYQRDEWGSLDGETCVIELSALAANSFKVPRDRELFREARIEHLRQRRSKYKPQLMVMYGLREKEHWEKIAGGLFGREGGIQTLDCTIFAVTRHPNTRGLTDTDWKGLAEALHRALQHSFINIASQCRTSPLSENA